MKTKWKRFIAMLVLVCCVVALLPDNIVFAASKKPSGTETGFAYKSSRYIYYAIEMSGTRTGIMRLDTKTKKKKEIVSYRYKGGGTNGFYDISVKGKYIYATWDLGEGTSYDAQKEYIYRFTKDGKSRKKLACGNNPVIIGNRIYYIKCKTITEYGSTFTESTGQVYSMKLDGTDKKKVGNKSCISLKRRSWKGGSDYFSISEGEEAVTVGNYKYYVGNSGKTIYRKNTKTGKTNKVITYANGVSTFMVQGDYVISKGLGKKTYVKKWNYWTSYYYAYSIKGNGTNKVKLLSWIPGE